ncbi:FAD-dependent monooxygenase [Frankia sp. CNm7]|uniref:FAD-dependent monooxygenase n=2 Tax=Frankia nepalensis TaxID=1836974 RepID=A0A937RPC2_9ACTN|nr:FAD-dependent monooxygenase [Frankia nepalensis]MBL7496264.1 FAD-dependent monooxygenase [Frankia nepalensis]MBL7513844.1 FAD-dependent monooxygenase [Frankia nepalensis]MBL7517582.1 FAD-dependent monooxygenase [Frankia nepalensis]MBL7633727.1 FAD-dependent monooxygenase [Frankia nepalensis]
MRIVCVGGGPAGLYFAICAKLHEPDHDITVLERDPPGATHGWGVVYWEPLLGILFRHDPVGARRLRAASTLWREQLLTLGGPRTAYLPGYGYSIQRAALLDLLGQRATELGIEVRHQTEVADAAELAELSARADLVVASDGAHSRVRRLAGPDAFGTRTDDGVNQFIWLGTDMRFENFRFAFERTPAGWIWFHAYPSAADISTCIVECAPETWAGLGLDKLDDEAGRRLLESIFAEQLAGHRLISSCHGRPARWQRFTHVTNRSWRHENIVLIGDAAHTTHFTLGSGTAFAIMDAVMLVWFLKEHGEVSAALREFDRSGRAALKPPQDAARTSMAWFERVDEILADLSPGGPAGDPDPVEFAFAMGTRQGDATPLRHRACKVHQVPAVRALGRQAGQSTRWLLDKRRELATR